MEKHCYDDALSEFITVSLALRGSRLDQAALKNHEEFVAAIAERLEVGYRTAMIALAIFSLNITEKNYVVNLGEIASYLGLEPFEMLKYAQEFKEFDYNWFVHQDSFAMDISSILRNTFIVQTSKIEALITGDLKKAEDSGRNVKKDIQKLLCTMQMGDPPFDQVLSRYKDIEETHSDNECVQNLIRLIPDSPEQRLLFIFLSDLPSLGVAPTLRLTEYHDVFGNPDSVEQSMRDGTHQFVTAGLLDVYDGAKGKCCVRPSSIAVKNLGKLLSIIPETTGELKPPNAKGAVQKIKSANQDPTSLLQRVPIESLGKKDLFFSEAVLQQVNDIHYVAGINGYDQFCQASTSSAVSSGISCLFYGPPGTGKTEMVYQIGRSTGRRIFQVDISTIRSKWYGETSENARKVFREYTFEKDRALSEKLPIPILLMNEADSLLSCRTEDRGIGPTQTENTLKNVFLEEMEKNDGLLFATTNFEGSLDKAFDRRFLFKVAFSIPDSGIRYKIWKSKLVEYDDQLLREIADCFSFSGGEIDNVVRKILLEKIIRPEANVREMIFRLCSGERIESSDIPIGFQCVQTT